MFCQTTIDHLKEANIRTEATNEHFCKVWDIFQYKDIKFQNKTGNVYKGYEKKKK